MKITIVIPTYERKELLKRSLFFWSRYPVRVLVLDGSRVPSLRASDLEDFANVEYHHLPMSLEKRFLFASEKIDTPYAALLSDDEFFLYSALESATQTLDVEPKVAAIVGATLGFTRHEHRLLWKYEYSTVRNLKMVGASPLERLRQRINTKGNSIYYSLARSEILNAGLKFIGEHEYSCPYIQEYQLEATFCCAGEVRFIPELMWIRNRSTPMVNLVSASRDLLFEDWLKIKKNTKEIKRLEESFAVHSKKINGLINIHGYNFIEVFGKDAPRSSTFVGFIKSTVPEPLYLLLKSFWNHFFKQGPSQFVNLGLARDKLKAHGVNINETEFNHVVNLITK